MASISEPFIRRPVGTTLGVGPSNRHGAYVFPRCRRAPRPFSDDRVSASRPGAASVMASTVAAPLERRLRSRGRPDPPTSSLGYLTSRVLMGATSTGSARDAAAINASLADLPTTAVAAQIPRESAAAQCSCRADLER
jgi:multidrug efflux pump